MRNKRMVVRPRGILRQGYVAFVQRSRNMRTNYLYAGIVMHGS